MLFYERSFRNTSPPSDAVFPCTVLIPDNWDDFGYNTLWRITVYRTRDEKILESAVKILQRDPDDASKSKTRTSIPSTFPSLNDSYCSLGPDMEYYEKLFGAGPEIYSPFLKALQDAATSPDVAARFKELPGFQKSLLRSSEAEKAFREAPSLFSNAIAELVVQFTFRCNVPGAIDAHEVAFDFTKHPANLNRIAFIIGKNGTGKTQFLAQLAGAISGWNNNPENRAAFAPQRPSFSRVIAVSYSVFDDFPRPPEDSRTCSYKYCGIRELDAALPETVEGVVARSETESGARFLSAQQLKARLLKARNIIFFQVREQTWNDILLILLEGTIDSCDVSLENLDFYDRLSSGQRILVAVMTEIIAHISKQSVILFDEPELHLHPEALAALARAFDRLLKEFDSYGIIATHSALLLQEALSRQVHIFRRRGNSPIVDPLTIESFGENLTTITREVFAVDGDKHNFRAHLEQLCKGRTADEVVQLFPIGLPLQGEAFVRALKETEQA